MEDQKFDCGNEGVDSEDISSFDFEAWKQQGTRVYETLGEKIAAMQEELDSLKAQRVGIGESLGMIRQAPVISRIKVRPRVLKLLSEAGRPMSREEVFNVLKEEVPKLEQKSFDEAVKRMLLTESVPVQEADGLLSLIG
jgi:hypothetical protein